MVHSLADKYSVKLVATQNKGVLSASGRGGWWPPRKRGLCAINRHLCFAESLAHRGFRLRKLSLAEGLDEA